MRNINDKTETGSEPEDEVTDPNARASQPSPAVNDEMIKLREERDRFLDLLQRTRADFLNYQKNAQRELDESQTYAIAKFARSLLEVVDNLTRAASLGQSEADIKALRSGVDLVLQLLLKILADNKVVPVEAVGKPFDPSVHEAIVQEARTDVPPMTVTEELVRGYKVGERLLRPAIVRVSKAPDRASSEDETASESSES